MSTALLSLFLSTFKRYQTHKYKQIPLWLHKVWLERIFFPSPTCCGVFNEIISLCQCSDKICIDGTSQSRVAVHGLLFKNQYLAAG